MKIKLTKFYTKNEKYKKLYNYFMENHQYSLANDLIDIVYEARIDAFNEVYRARKEEIIHEYKSIT